MKIEVDSKKVFINSGYTKEEIHPFWLRERINSDDALDKGTQQRLFDPTSLNSDINIDKIEKQNGFLQLFFTDGTNYKVKEDHIISEYKSHHLDPISIEKVKWNSSFKDLKNYSYSDDLFESKEMHDLLLSFYKYGFVIIKDVPTEDNFLVKFANKVGSVRRTNFGEHFNAPIY